jgi:branched-chain amino acid transport system permease protein
MVSLKAIPVRHVIPMLSILLVIAPFAIGPRFLDIAIIALIFTVMAMGLHFIVGLCRLFDLGLAGFVCIGAYCTGILMVRLHWSYWAAAGVAVLLSMISGIILGLPTLRLNGDYFAIVTFGFSEVVVLIMRNWRDLTGGPFGLGGIPDPAIFGHTISRFPPRDYYFLALGMLTLVLCLHLALRRTMLGAQMVAVGDDEPLCTITGIDVVYIRAAALALTAGVGGLAGSFWAIYFKFLSHADFTLNLSVQVLAIVILAGSRRIESVLIAGLALAPLGELLRRWLRTANIPEAGRVILYGILLILVIWYRSRSIREDANAVA